MAGVCVQKSASFCCNPEGSCPGTASVVCHIGWCIVHYTCTCSLTPWGW